MNVKHSIEIYAVLLSWRLWKVHHSFCTKEGLTMHLPRSKPRLTSLKTFTRFSILFLIIFLVSCAGTNPVTTQPTPTPTSSSVQFTNYDLKLPAKALNAPIVGDLPGNQQLHVGVTFKVDQSVLDQLKKQKIKPGQKVDGQAIAKQMGISDTTYQQIKSFFGLNGLSLNIDQKHL